MNPFRTTLIAATVAVAATAGAAASETTTPIRNLMSLFDFCRGDCRAGDERHHGPDDD